MITRYTPIGVVGAVVPWNFAILLAVWKIAPALVAGCTIIVKPSPFPPLCDLKMVELLQELAPPVPGSIGVALPGIEVRVADLSDVAATPPPGTPGELMVLGPS